MNWALTENLPRKGRDTEFDKLLKELGFFENRRYQSQRWLEFRKNNGLVPAPTYKWTDSKQLRDQLMPRHLDLESILKNAVEQTIEILKEAD
jgi:hypothetical protein